MIPVRVSSGDVGNQVPQAADSRSAASCQKSVLLAENLGSAFATKRYRCYAWLMARTITQRELRNDSGAILREVQAGQAIIVTRNGVPVAELRAVPQRRFVPRAAIAVAARQAPSVERARLRADLDALVDQSVDG